MSHGDVPDRLRLGTPEEPDDQIVPSLHRARGEIADAAQGFRSGADGDVESGEEHVAHPADQGTFHGDLLPV